MIARSRAHNRSWLILLGLLLVIAGLLALAVATGLADRELPGDLVAPPPEQDLGEALGQEGWLPVAVLAAAVITAILLLVWLIRAVPRPPRRSTMQLHRDGRGGVTVLPSKVLSDAVEAAAEELAHVVSARAHISGVSQRADVLLVVEVDERGDLAELARGLTRQVCGDLATSLESTLGEVTIVLDPVLRTGSSRTAAVDQSAATTASPIHHSERRYVS